KNQKPIESENAMANSMNNPLPHSTSVMESEHQLDTLIQPTVHSNSDIQIESSSTLIGSSSTETHSMPSCEQTGPHYGDDQKP
ncbi:hypothetical protein Dimus_003834, partial [Dionaea muscipula]